MNNPAQSNPEGELERLGGLRKSREPEEEGLNSEGLGEAAGGVARQSVEVNEQKKAKKWLVILLILAGVIVVGVVSAVLVMKPWEGEENVPVVEAGKDEDKSESESSADENPEIENRIEELDINSELVQKLYGQVSGKMYYNTFGVYLDLWLRLIGNGASDEYVKYIALNNAAEAECKVIDRKVEIATFDNQITLAPEQDNSANCISGKAVRDKAREIFGRDITFAQNEDIRRNGWFAPMYYDAENDEFWQNLSGGGGMTTVVDNVLYRAEKDKNRIYIYELMAQRCTVYDTNDGESLVCLDEFPDLNDGEVPAKELRWYKIDEKSYDGSYNSQSWIGSNIPEMTTTEYEKLSQYFGDMVDIETQRTGWKMFEEQNKQNMLEHADLVSQFRWVFVKNTEGNYVFEKLERVK